MRPRDLFRGHWGSKGVPGGPRGSQGVLGGPRGSGGHLGDPMGSSAWFDESSDDSRGIYACT